MDVTIKEISDFEDAVMRRDRALVADKTEAAEAYYVARKALEQRCVSPVKVFAPASAKRECPVPLAMVQFQRGLLVGLAGRPDIDPYIKDVLMATASNMQSLMEGYGA